MTQPVFNKEYWDQRYKSQQTQWDAGTVTTPIKSYLDQLENKELKILIPGAGNSHEAEYAFKTGFTNVYVVDISDAPLRNLITRIPDFPNSHLLHHDFFELKGTYDLIIEQTFFCALHPSERNRYSQKMASLLNPGGRLVGVFFSCEFEGGPPFGGSKAEYSGYFDKLFDFHVFDTCYNSIPPREGRELFLNLVRK